jgi:hypothetical protein
MSDAVRHVSRARRIVAQQRALIAQRKAEGHLITSHEYTLDLFERTLRLFEDPETLRLFEDQERQLRAELERRYPGGGTEKGRRQHRQAFGAVVAVLRPPEALRFLHRLVAGLAQLVEPLRKRAPRLLLRLPLLHVHPPGIDPAQVPDGRAVAAVGAADDGVDGREREARLVGDPAERHARLP